MHIAGEHRTRGEWGGRTRAAEFSTEQDGF